MGHPMPDLLGTYSLVLFKNACSGVDETPKAFGDCLLRNMTKGSKRDYNSGNQNKLRVRLMAGLDLKVVFQPN